VELIDRATLGADQTSRVYCAGRALTVMQQRSRPAPDKEWLATDEAGHVHAFGDAENPFPTLIRVSDGWADPCESCSDCGDIERYHLACAACGQVMWPAPEGPDVELLPGAFFYWIDGQRATEREAREFVNLIRAEDPDRYERLRYWLKYSAGLAPVRHRVTRD
jgi:hypothetical protein